MSDGQASVHDVPGAVVFTGARCRQGYALNQFCMSLMRPENRERFKADEAAYLADWDVTPQQRDAVLTRDYRTLVSTLGGNIFFVLKLAATDARSTQSVVAEIAGETLEDYVAMMRSGGRAPAPLAA